MRSFFVSLYQPLKPAELVLNKGHIDSVKGMLILFVIMGHIQLWLTDLPQIFHWVNNFHVICFLLLVFIYPSQPLSFNNIRKWGVRYLWPFLICTLFYSTIYLLFVIGTDNISSWFKNLFTAIIIGSSHTLDQAMGFQSLWYLPALFSLLIVKAYLQERPAIAVILVTLTLHGSIGLIAEPDIWYIPFGLGIVCYVAFIGFTLQILLKTLPLKHLKLIGILGLIIFGILQYFSWETGTRIGPSRLRLQDFLNPGLLVFYDILILSATLFLLSAQWLKHITPLRWLGQNSLQIYLIHHFVYHALIEGLKLLNYEWTSSLWTGLLAFACVLYVSVVSTWILNKTPKIKLFLFPR